MFLNCNLCSSSIFELVYKKDTESYNICTNCSHVFQLQVNYPSYYHTLPCTFPKDYHSHCTRRAKYIADFISPFNDRKIMDIGCGRGGVMNELGKLSPHPDVQLRGCTLEQINDFRIQTMDIEEDQLLSSDFDLGIMCHVLEHFRHPIKVLSKYRNYMKPTARLYIEVPSWHWTEVRVKSAYTPEHLSYFTVGTLTNALHAAGFQIIKMHESRYWGNIKTIVSPSNSQNILLKKLDYKNTLMYHSFAKWLHLWYRIGLHWRNIDPND